MEELKLTSPSHTEGGEKNKMLQLVYELIYGSAEQQVVFKELIEALERYGYKVEKTGERK